MPKLRHHDRLGTRLLATQAITSQAISCTTGNQVFPFVTNGVPNTVPTMATLSVGRTIAGLIKAVFSDIDQKLIATSVFPLYQILPNPQAGVALHHRRFFCGLEVRGGICYDGEESFAGRTPNARDATGGGVLRILIIGGTGFSGPYVTHRLSELGYEIALFHRGQTQANLPPSVKHIPGDRRRLTNFADELKRFAPQIVLDMIPATEQDARRVMGLFRGIAQRVVALSSQDVYRAYGKLIHIESGSVETVPLTEEAPLRRKLYPYRGQAQRPDDRTYHYEKILVERVFMSDPELPGTVLRLPMVYGPRDPQHRLFEYLKRMDDGRPAILLEEGLANWRWTRGYVENVAVAITLAVTNEQAAGRIYNVGEAKALSIAEWVRKIGRAAGWKGNVVIAPEGRLPVHLTADINTNQHLVVDTTRIRKELGYDEVVSQAEALRQTIAWERAHPPAEIDRRLFDYAAEDAILSALGRSSG